MINNYPILYQALVILKERERSIVMKEKFLSLILYPALADGLSKKEREELKTFIKGMERVNQDELIDALSQRLSLQEMQELASLVPQEEKVLLLSGKTNSHNREHYETRRRSSERAEGCIEY